MVQCDKCIIQQNMYCCIVFLFCLLSMSIVEHFRSVHVYTDVMAEHTVKPRPEAHMDMIFFEEHRLDSTTTDITTALFIFIIIDKVIVLSDLVESSEYSSKTLQKGLCPYAPLDEVLR